MGLDLLPRPTTPNSKELPKGMVHLAPEPCPFEDDGNPRGVFATCCSLRGSEVAFYLLALGFNPLLLRLFEDKLPEESLEFAEWMRQTVTDLTEHMVKAANERRARKGEPPTSDPVEGFTAKTPGINWEFQLSEAFRVIEAAAAWHQKVARMHCGVHAWY